MDENIYENTEGKPKQRKRVRGAGWGGSGQWGRGLSQMLTSAENSARSHHVTAKLDQQTRTTPGSATLDLSQIQQLFLERAQMQI